MASIRRITSGATELHTLLRWSLATASVALSQVRNGNSLAETAAFVALKQHGPDQAEGEEEVDDEDDVLHEACTIFANSAAM